MTLAALLLAALYSPASAQNQEIETPSIRITTYGGSGWNVVALAVAPEARRQGVGKSLLAALEDRAANEGHTFVRLNCNTARTDAHIFYERMGYTCDKTQKRFIKTIG